MNTLELLLASSPMRALGWTLLHFVWQGLLLFALHELLQLFLRRRSASLRYVTSCVVLLGMLASAVLTMQLELRRTSVGAGEVQAQATRLETSAQSAFRAAREGATPPVVVSTPSDPHSSSATVGVTDDRQHELLTQARALLQARFPSLDRLLPWLVSLWFAGVFLLTTRLAIGWQEARWLRTRAVRPVTAKTHAQVRALLSRLRISRPVRVLESSLAEVPTVVGWLRPVVLLPTAALTGLPPQHLEALLAHELSHVRRHDTLVNLMQVLVETLLFYHPAVWWVSDRIRNERENCCDDVAVRLCGDAVLYARALTSMEELRRGPLQPELAMAADGGSLVHRVRRVVGRGGDPEVPGAGVVAAAVLIGLSSLLTVAVARTADIPSPADTSTVASEDTAQANRSESPGGKIAGFKQAQPAPQLPRPVSSPRPTFSLEDIVRLEKHDITTDYYDSMMAALGPLDVDEVIALKVHEVDGRYVEQMVEQFGRLDVEELLALRVQDVDVDYVREMSRVFERRVELEEVVHLRAQRVHSDDIAAYRRQDMDLDPEDVAALSACGVDPEEIGDLQDLHLRGASLEDLVQAAQAGFDAGDFEDLQDTLGPIGLEEGIALLTLGVDGQEIEELRDMGMADPDVDELITMYSQGLTADVIDTILDDRMDEVSVETLMLFKELGLEDVFLAEFRRRNE
jgi:beta-lactamase regulating signal transducer with metallopeptidase domain